MRRAAIAFSTGLMLAASAALAQDPAVVASNVYKCSLENARIRACEVTFAKGAKAAMHSHPDHLAYVIAGGKLKLTTKDGKDQVIDAKDGQMIWLTAQSHAAENLGDSTIRILVVEIKGKAKKK